MSVVAAKAVGSTSFGAAICTDTATCQSTEPFYKSTAAAEGIKFAGSAGMPSSAPSYTAQCLTLIQAGSNSILLSLPPTVAVRVVNDCSQQGFSGSFILSGTTFDQEQFESYKGTSFIGGLMAFPWWSNAAPVKQFRDVMAQYAPKLNYRDAATTVTWAALELFRQAMGTPVGDVTSASVIKAYDSLHAETLGGLLPQPMTFTAGQPSPPVNCFWLFKYKAGDKDPVTVRKGPPGNGVQGDLASSCYTS
jgi:branched-chain amino acid transport system substrate-binding protein